MRMKLSILLPILVAVPALVMAQGLAPQAPDPQAQLGAEWQAYMNEQEHVMERLRAYMLSANSARAQAEETAKYWKGWCGDAPGCAVPKK